MNKEEFVLELKKIGIDVSDGQLVLLDKYYKLLIEWNEKINLTRITEEKDVYLNYLHNEFLYYANHFKNKINFVFGTYEQTKVLSPKIR